jgi:hypothetical protein
LQESKRKLLKTASEETKEKEKVMTQQSTLDQVAGTKGANKPVHIIDDKGTVDRDDVDIYKKSGDEVTWIADVAASTIDFTNGSPFTGGSSFQVPAGGSASSGPVRKDAEPKRYKYTVTGPKGHNDPGVIIHN